MIAPQPHRHWPHRATYALWGAVLSAGAPLGYLLVRGFSGPRTPDLDWLRFELSGQIVEYFYLTLSTLAVFVILGFVLGRREDGVERESLTDPLTGLGNRRHLESRLREELARTERYGSPLSVLLIDVDGLKQINDSRGHAAGDDALRAVAATLEKNRRTTDLAARFGGDEFVVLAPSTGHEEALEFARRISGSLDPPGSPATVDWPPVAVSIGVAGLRGGEDADPEALLRAADEALYAAKAEHRKRRV